MRLTVSENATEAGVPIDASLLMLDRGRFRDERLEEELDRGVAGVGGGSKTCGGGTTGLWVVWPAEDSAIAADRGGALMAVAFVVVITVRRLRAKQSDDGSY